MKKTRFIPFGGRALIQQYDDGKGTLVVPESVKAKEKPSLGIVLEVGPEFNDKGVVDGFGDVKPGDVVAFPIHGPMEIQIAGARLFIVERQDLLGKLVTMEVPDDQPRRPVNGGAPELKIVE